MTDRQMLWHFPHNSTDRAKCEWSLTNRQTAVLQMMGHPSFAMLLTWVVSTQKCWPTKLVKKKEKRWPDTQVLLAWMPGGRCWGWQKHDLFCGEQWGVVLPLLLVNKWCGYEGMNIIVATLHRSLCWWWIHNPNAPRVQLLHYQHQLSIIDLHLLLLMLIHSILLP